MPRKPNPERAKELHREQAMLTLADNPANAPKIKALDEARLLELRRLAGARCECTGQCGQSHGFEEHHPAQRCRAPHGCNIVRKIASPGFWQLAPSAASGPLAYPEGYTQKSIEVDLQPVAFGDDLKCFCQRCRGLTLRMSTDEGDGAHP